MEITVKVVLDDEMIANCANAAARSLFTQPEYGRGGGQGYHAISAQVKAAVETLDFTEVARETAQRFARGIIEDVTKDALKKMAKDTVKALKEDGSLLEP